MIPILVSRVSELTFLSNFTFLLTVCLFFCCLLNMIYDSKKLKYLVLILIIISDLEIVENQSSRAYAYHVWRFDSRLELCTIYQPLGNDKHLRVAVLWFSISVVCLETVFDYPFWSVWLILFIMTYDASSSGRSIDYLFIIY